MTVQAVAGVLALVVVASAIGYGLHRWYVNERAYRQSIARRAMIDTARRDEKRQRATGWQGIDPRIIGKPKTSSTPQQMTEPYITHHAAEGVLEAEQYLRRHWHRQNGGNEK